MKNTSQLTDYNYSFCDESDLMKENICPNGQSLHNKIDNLEKLIRRQSAYQSKSNIIIKQQGIKLEKMERYIEDINRILNIGHKVGLGKNIISPISCHQSINQSSIQQYSNSRIDIKPFTKHSKHTKHLKSIQSNQRKSTKRVQSQSNKTKHRKKQQSIHHFDSKFDKNDSNYREDTSKLLSTIVQRKLHIQKELKQRLKSHIAIKVDHKMNKSIMKNSFITGR